MILVSACLLGRNCKYNGGNNFSSRVKELLADKKIKLICPEVKGELSVPRSPAEIVKGDGFDVLAGRGRVMTENNKDVTDFFIRGAKKSLENLKSDDIDFVVLKARSPSCGSGHIYSGQFNGQLKSGSGVAAAYFKQQGITVLSEHDIDKIEELIKE